MSFLKKYNKKKMRFKLKNFWIDIVGFSDAEGIGYIRFVDDIGCYRGSIDCDDRLPAMKRLRDALDTMIKQKEDK